MNSRSGFVDVPGSRIHFRADGKAGAPVLVLSNSLGTDLSLWQPQISALASRLRVVRYDGRGHGSSPAGSGAYTIELLANDLVALLDRLEIAAASFCGLSLGGMVGQWLGINVPNRLHKLVLCSTAAKIGSAETWNARINLVLKGGMPAVTESTLDRWFTAAFSRQNPVAVQRIRQMLLATPAEGYIANCAAVRDADFRAALPRLRPPTLIISSTHDRSTPPADGKFLAEHIPGAKYFELNAAHLANVEAARPFTEIILEFVAS
jgi:3-oxoadipate enol-lactonase